LYREFILKATLKKNEIRLSLVVVLFGATGKYLSEGWAYLSPG